MGISAAKRARIQQAIRSLMMENKLNQSITNELVHVVFKGPQYERFFLYVEILSTNPIIDYVFNTDHEISIGRDREWSRICIQDIHISRRHALISVQNGEVFISNISQSSVVTLKRGLSKQVISSGEASTVRHGDVVCIGDAKLRIMLFRGEDEIAN